MVQHHDRGGGLLRLDHEVRVGAPVRAPAGDVHAERRVVGDVLGGDQVQRLLGAGGGDRGGQILGHQHAAAGRLAGGERRGLRGALGHGHGVVDGGVALAVVGGGVLEEGGEAAQRGEAPLLDVALGHGVVGDLEGAQSRAAVQRGVGGGDLLARQAQVLLLQLRRGRRVGALQGLSGGDGRGARRVAHGLVRGRVPGALGTLHISGRHQPTAPSICSSIRRFSSRAYSIGSSRAMGSMKPRTIIAIASVSSMPRLIR